MAGSSMIGNLAVNLSMETAAFHRGAAKAEARAKTLQTRLGGIAGTMKSFAGGMVAGLGVAAISGFVSNAFQMASALSEAAEASGVTVEALQELRMAAQQTGVSEEQLTTALSRLNRSMGDLQLGKKSAVDAFAAIGLAADDLKGKTPEQALRIIADQLNKLPDVQQRVAIGAQIMGRGFSALLPLINGGSKALDGYAAASQKAGQISTADAKKLDELADTWERLKVRVGVATANMIAGTVRFMEFYDGLVRKFWSVRDGVISAVTGMASETVAQINRMVAGISNAVTGRLNAIWEGVKAKVESVKQKFRDLAEAVSLNSYIPDMVDGIAESMGRLSEVMVNPAVEAANAVDQAMRDISMRGIDMLADGITGVIMGTQKLGTMFKNVARQMLADIIQLIARTLILRAVMSIFGGGGPLPGMPGAKSDPSIVVTGLPKFAKGGSFMVGGRAGTDRNLLSLNGSPVARVSRGERVNVSNDNPRGGTTIINMNGVITNDQFWNEIDQRDNMSIARAAPAIVKASTMHTTRSLQRPRLP